LDRLRRYLYAMKKVKHRPSSPSSTGSHGSATFSRRELLAGAGAGAAALFLKQNGVQAESAPMQAPAGRAIVFANTTVVNAESTQDDVALAVEGDKIVAIGPSAEIVARYPNADVYDGRGKAILPGLVNCHMHMSAVLSRGFNEDFGFPNSVRLAVQPGSLLQGEESQLMVKIAALEALRTGTTTIIENTGNIIRNAAALASTGLRCVFAESVRDAENVPGPMAPEGLANTKEAPKFSQKLREDGMAKIQELFAAWNGKNNGRVRVFPAAGLAETSSPELLKAVREFADKNNLGYTIHLSQTTWENDFMKKWHGLSPVAFLDKAGFLGPRLFAAHARYLDPADIATLGRTRTIITHQANMAANRGVIPPIAKLRAAGATIALGTDNNTNDVFSVMKIALLTERISRTEDARPGTRPQPEDILADCTQGGAAAANQSATVGTLEVGKKADLIVIDTMKPYLQPAGRILSAIIHGGQSSDVESVMVDGQFVMRSNKVLTMDEPALLAEASKVSRRVWDQVKKAGPIPVPREARPKTN
jgi:5-methylthioadenosine/S-adenosylhomocysteine deaminase